MTTQSSALEDPEWRALHDRIVEALSPFGRLDAFLNGDYWLLDDDLGRRQQELEVQNLALLQPHIIKLLQALLASYPEWRITVSVVIIGSGWPGMGVIIYPDEIVDELQRQYFPAEFQGIKY